jgi:AraC-like DNA-binding protein
MTTCNMIAPERRTPTDAEEILRFVNRVQPLVLQWRHLSVEQQAAGLREAVAEVPKLESLAARMILAGVVSAVASVLSHATPPQDIGDPGRLTEQLLACLPVEELEQYPQIKLAIRHMQSSFRDSSLNTRAVAREIGYTPSHFGRLFKKVTGSAFVHVLRRHRIALAFQSLQEGRLSVKEIAASVGYKHVADFDRHFKLETGMCPTMVRRVGDRQMQTLSTVRDRRPYQIVSLKGSNLIQWLESPDVVEIQ